MLCWKLAVTGRVELLLQSHNQGRKWKMAAVLSNPLLTPSVQTHTHTPHTCTHICTHKHAHTTHTTCIHNAHACVCTHVYVR